MTLRARLLAGLGLIAIVLGVVLVVITRTAEDTLLDQVDEQLVRSVGPARGFSVGQRVAVANEAFSPSESPRQFSAVYVALVIDDAVYTVVSPASVTAAAELPNIDPAVATAAAATGTPFTVRSQSGDIRYRTRADIDRAGSVVVVSVSLAAVDDTIATLHTVELIGAGVILLALGAVTWWVLRLGIRPVKRMTDVATAIAAGDLSPRVPELSPRTEAGALGVALNQMLGNIEGAFDERRRAEDTLRRFVADASHELRTPLATVRGYAELYRAGALEDPDDLRDAMRRTEQEAMRMGALVDDLLHLARLDEGRALDVVSVDLRVIVADAARDAAAVQPARPIEARVAEPVIVRGCEPQLRQVLANLVTNALVHTDDDVPVELMLHRHGEQACIQVIDRGAGMAPEVAARVFERFYRADRSRSRRRGGSGLGLSIVDSIVRAHGGRVTLTSAVGRGTTVRVELPAVVAADGPIVSELCDGSQPVLRFGVHA